MDLIIFFFIFHSRNASVTFALDGMKDYKGVGNKTIDFSEDGTVRSVDLSIVNLNRERVWDNIGEFRGKAGDLISPIKFFAGLTIIKIKVQK